MTTLYTCQSVRRYTVSLNEIYRAMRDGEPITMTLQNGVEIRGVPVGISAEDGSRKAWNVRIAGRSAEYFIRTR